MANSRIATSSILQGTPKSRSMLVGNEFYDPASYDSIATITLSSPASTITFSSIPQGYSHLQLRGIARTTYPGTGGGIDYFMNFNGDTNTANYRMHYLWTNGSSSYAGSFGNSNGFFVGYGSQASATAQAGIVVLDILDYSNTNKNKTARGLYGNQFMSSGDAASSSGAWFSTAAITSLTLDAYSTSDFNNFTSFALYGIK